MFFRGFQQCDLICHSLAFADPDECGGGGRGRTSLKKFFWFISEKGYWTPSPVCISVGPPGILGKVGTSVNDLMKHQSVWPESPRDFSKTWTSQLTLPGNWLNSLLYMFIV